MCQPECDSHFRDYSSQLKECQVQACFSNTPSGAIAAQQISLASQRYCKTPASCLGEIVALTAASSDQWCLDCPKVNFIAGTAAYCLSACDTLSYNYYPEIDLCTLDEKCSNVFQMKRVPGQLGLLLRGFKKNNVCVGKDQCQFLQIVANDFQNNNTCSLCEETDNFEIYFSLGGNLERYCIVGQLAGQCLFFSQSATQLSKQCYQNPDQSNYQSCPSHMLQL